MNENPPQRIGDAQRDRAVELLREHLAEGRLDAAEFDDRLSRALTARTQADLDPLFVDLPGPRVDDPQPAGFVAPPWQQASGQGLAPRPATPVPARKNHAWQISSSVAWPLVIVFCFATGWQYWWVIFIPLVLSSMQRQQRSRDRGGR